MLPLAIWHLSFEHLSFAGEARAVSSAPQTHRIIFFAMMLANSSRLPVLFGLATGYWLPATWVAGKARAAGLRVIEPVR